MYYCGCSGVLNLKVWVYYSGEIEDFSFFLEWFYDKFL